MKYSIFIPHLSNEISSDRIRLELGGHLLGDIDKIDVVIDKKNRKCNMVFVHYSKWNSDNIQTTDIKNKLDGGEFCALYILSTQCFWKILKAKVPDIAFNPIIFRPSIFDNSSATSSIFSDLIKNNKTVSLFDRMKESDSFGGLIPNTNTPTVNSDNKIQELEKRISKLEKYIYNNIA